MNTFQKISILKDIIACKYFGARVPVSVHFALTNRCPWRCAYCSVNAKDTAEVTTEQAVYIIRQLAAGGNKRLHFTGGEPLLREDIGQLVKEAKACGLFVNIATSGYKLPEKWEAVKDIDIFFLSLDGPAEVHDFQRGKGAFAVLSRAMEFLNSKKKKFWTTTVITRNNVRHLDYILDKAKKEGFIANFHLLYFSPQFGSHHDSIHPDSISGDLAMDDRESRQALEYLLKRKNTDMKHTIGSSALYFECLLNWPDYAQVYRKDKSPYYDCMAGRLYCYIDANGDVYPCCDLMGVVKPRNILQEGFKQAFRQMPPLPCQSCLVACFTELNLMFSLKLRSILNWANRI